MADMNFESSADALKKPHASIQHNLWIVIADRTKARILSMNGRDFDVVRVFHADGDMDDGLDNDTVGRGGSYGAGRHKYEPGMEESRQVELGLAQKISIALETSLARRDFAELAVAAPPQMLGEIRKALPATVLKTLVAESDKNMTGLADRELREELLSVVPGPDRK